jgi:hypothetical protein
LERSIRAERRHSDEPRVVGGKSERRQVRARVQGVREQLPEDRAEEKGSDAQRGGASRIRERGDAETERRESDERAVGVGGVVVSHDTPPQHRQEDPSSAFCGRDVAKKAETRKNPAVSHPGGFGVRATRRARASAARRKIRAAGSV